MPAYTPDYTITIAGTEYTSQVLNNATITTGRPDIFTDTLAGYANIELAITSGSIPALELKQSVNIKVTDSSSADVDLFTGEISAINKSLAGAGANGTATVVQIQAVGSIAKLVRSFVGTSSYPTELDGERVERILTEALFTQWEDVPNTLTWADVAATQEWADYGVQGIDIIDDGRYDLLARNAEIVNAFDLVTQTARDGLGYLYETPDGLIGYAGAERRTSTFGANQIELNGELLNYSAVQTRLSSADIVNSVYLTYDDPEAAVEAVNDQSIEDYGLIQTQITTSLSDQTQAEEQALRLVSLRGTPLESFDLISINLSNPNLDNIERDLLLGVSMDTLVKVTNLPTGFIIGNAFEGFVEGWTWFLAQGSLELEAQVSNSIYSAFEVQWEDYDPTTQWQNLSGSLTWNDLAIG
jgi:hypothetical protein